MMTDALTVEGMKYLISRLLDNAYNAVEERKQEPSNDFLEGKCLAYFEMLDILRSELDVRDQDLKQFGLDIDLENEIA